MADLPGSASDDGILAGQTTLGGHVVKVTDCGGSANAVTGTAWIMAEARSTGSGAGLLHANRIPRVHAMGREIGTKNPDCLKKRSKYESMKV